VAQPREQEPLLRTRSPLLLATELLLQPSVNASTSSASLLATSSEHRRLRQVVFKLSEDQKVAAGHDSGPIIPEFTDWYGSSVSVDGNIAVIGAPWRDDKAGAAYVYTRPDSTGEWELTDKLVGNPVLQGARFGRSVAVSGNTIVVGATGEAHHGAGCGAAYIFMRSRSGRWVQRFKYPDTRETTCGNLETWLIGRSVDIDGDNVVVGSPYYGDEENLGGAVKVFRRIRPGRTWEEKFTLEPMDLPNKSKRLFGYSVAVSGNSFVVGAPKDDYFDADRTDSVAYFFLPFFSKDAWAKIPNPADDLSEFGYAVAVSDTTIVVGAPFDLRDPASGAAYVFRRNGLTLNKERKLVPDNGYDLQNFGCAVAASGNSVVVGGRGVRLEHYGTAYLFEKKKGSWKQRARLLSTDREPMDYFGWDVAIDPHGTIVVGAPQQRWNEEKDWGSAYTYHHVFDHRFLRGCLKTKSCLRPDPPLANRGLFCHYKRRACFRVGILRGWCYRRSVSSLGSIILRKVPCKSTGKRLCGKSSDCRPGRFCNQKGLCQSIGLNPMSCYKATPRINPRRLTLDKWWCPRKN